MQALYAGVAELADAQDLKSCGTYTPVSVRFRSPAYFKEFVGIAQLDRAFGYGPKGRGFESSNARFGKNAGSLCLQGFPVFLRFEEIKKLL